jgi:hypothetical protein
MRTSASSCLALTILVLAMAMAYAAGEGPEDSGGGDFQKKLEEAISSGVVTSASALTDGVDPARPDEPPAQVQDAETLDKYHRALRAYYDYRATGLEHRKAVFEWQLFSAKLIFCIVLIVVATGIVLAIMQFRAELKLVQEGKSATLSKSELEASSSGVKVSSSIVGIIILTLSLAFFYLYLVYVYPIEDIF